MSKFDYKQALTDYICPQMLKAGLEYYFEVNDFKPKNKTEFEKIIENYKKIKMGV